MKHVSLMIGDRDVFAADGRTFDRIDPFTGNVASRAAAASVADAIAAADAAAAAFPAWAALGPGERRTNAAQGRRPARRQGRRNSPQLMTAEMRRHRPVGRISTAIFAASLMREAASMTTQIAGEVIPSDKPNSFAMAIRQPVGVVLGIAPWNAPVILGVRAIAMPLACGNTVVLKASEMCPGTHALIGTIMREAGLPPGVVNVVTNAPADAAEGGRDADRASGGAAHQLHRLDQGRPHHRRDRRALSQAGAARARRQGADGHPRRRRSRRGGEGRGLRLLRQHGPDLHVDRAADRRREGRRRVRGEVRRQGALAAARRSARPCHPRLAGDQGSGRAQQGAARRRGRQGREGRGRRRVQRHGRERDGARPRDAGDAHLHARSRSAR